jgi:alkaline phosphatase
MACNVSAQAPRRVIVYVGDGVGTGHWTIARWQQEHLAVDDFPTVGLIDTRNAQGLVTESAAAATAFAVGERTFAGALGLGPDSLPRPTALERARERGLATGLITTTSLTDATPAAFCAHYPSRSHLDVARQMADQHIDVLLGGGRRVFAYAQMDDSTSALDYLRRRTTYVETATQLRGLDLDTVATLSALLADGDLPLAGARDPSLATLTETALTLLDRDPEGFFLLVENEETDTQAHHNEPLPVLAAEMRSLDAAIRVGLDYQHRHPETLLLVLGDHETGGMTIYADSTGAPVIRYGTTGHSANLVPLFAKGPGAERFGGMQSNDAIGRLLAAVIGG